jgi:hypothetical protein
MFFLNNYSPQLTKMPREWDNDTRHFWNPKIHNILKTIDLHTELHLKTGNDFHYHQAEILRKYVSDLKTWIHSEESENL